MNYSLPLPNFIRKNLSPITDEWRDFAETIAKPGTSDLVLRDHIHEILFFIADDIEMGQTDDERYEKSRGKKDGKMSPASIHAILRRDIGFNMVEMIAEYRALRATVITLWTQKRIALTDRDVTDLVRFNEAIDQLLMQSVACFLDAIDAPDENQMELLADGAHSNGTGKAVEA